MIKLEDFNEATRIAFAHMRPGVLTNHVMNAEEYRVDIANGSLFAHTWPGGVLFLRKRETYHMLSYCINDTSILPDCALPGDAFAEIAYKPAGAEKALCAVEFWKQMGLKQIFERIRLSRLDIPVIARLSRSPLACAVAAPQDIDTCCALIRVSFDNRTGYIPDYRELEASLANGHIMCMKDSYGVVCGLLRWIPHTASIEIRQFALREDMRGNGLARMLLNAFIKKYGNGKVTVWVRDGYTPAIKSYVSAGFTADGWRSAVLA